MSASSNRADVQRGAGGARRARPLGRRSALGLLATRDLVEVRFGGSGGQGVILMGVILAMAGARDHRFVVQTQSYGPEARGGYSRSDVIISDSPIDYPELEPRRSSRGAVAGGRRRVHGGSSPRRRSRIRLRERCRTPRRSKESGSASRSPVWPSRRRGGLRPTNILTLGAVAGITGVVTTESLRKAVLAMVPAGTEEMNSKALARGLALDAAEWRGAAQSRAAAG